MKINYRENKNKAHRQCAKSQKKKKKKKLKGNEGTKIHHIRKRNEINHIRSICPFKQSLKEKELQLMNRPFIPSKYVYFLPSNPYKIMGDHTPKHLSFASVKLLWPTNYKFHHIIMYVGPCNWISKIMLGLSPLDVECWLYTLLIVIVTKQKTYF